MSSPAVDQLDGEAKRSYVREMFSAIAPRYDFLNHALTFNIDRQWRRAAVRRLGWPGAPAGAYLDLCAGTLDLAIELERQAGFRGTVVGADFAIPMLQLGKTKSTRVHPVGADALGLPFGDAAFDGCMVGFGVRNFSDLDRGLQEIARVLKPGGRLVILDLSVPRRWPIRPLYAVYARYILPLIGRLVSRHVSAYDYLPASIQRFSTPAELVGRLARAGFREARAEDLTLGIAVLLSGVRA